MAANGNIAIYDGKATPVLHTFYPVSAVGGKFIYREAVSGVPFLGQATLELDCSRLTPTNGVGVLKTKLTVPVMETIGSVNAAGYTSAPKVAHWLTKEEKWTFHSRSVEAERKDLRVMSQEFSINSAILQDIVQKFLSPVT